MKTSVKKVLFYTDTSIYGGAEKQMLVLAKHLNPNKYRPIFVVRQSEQLEHWFRAIREANIELHILNVRHKNSPRNMSRLARVIRQTRPALIHAHVWNPMACKYAFPVAWWYNIPLVTTEHDPFELPLAKRIYKILSLQQASRIMMVSQANRELMDALYPSITPKTLTVHNGIEESHVDLKSAERTRIRKEIFQAGLKTKVILSVGALHKRKGHKYLILAFRDILNKHNNTILAIVGIGPDQANLMDMVKNLDMENNVLFLGHRTDIDALMQSSDIFVLPSLKEAFGLVILEAMQNGLPIIATQAGGVPEIISHKDLGLLFKPANKDDLASDMDRLLSDAALQKRFRENGLIHWQKFTADRMARNTEAVYYLALNPET